jgi:hypothetical protein
VHITIYSIANSLKVHFLRFSPFLKGSIKSIFFTIHRRENKRKKIYGGFSIKKKLLAIVYNNIMDNITDLF